MPSYNTSDLKKGLKVLIDNEPHIILEAEFMKPGKGQAVYRTRMKNLILALPLLLATPSC